MSPPSDNVIFDNQCYATTPSSSNGNSDMEQPNHCNSRRCNGGQTYQQSMQSVSTPGSPTSRLLLEYEMHLRNTLAKGMDAESYSLRTFEALLTQSMENLGEISFNRKKDKYISTTIKEILLLKKIYRLPQINNNENYKYKNFSHEIFLSLIVCECIFLDFFYILLTQIIMFSVS